MNEATQQQLSSQTEAFNMGVEVGKAVLRYEAAIQQRDAEIERLKKENDSLRLELADWAEQKKAKDQEVA